MRAINKKRNLRSAHRQRDRRRRAATAALRSQRPTESETRPPPRSARHHEPLWTGACSAGGRWGVEIQSEMESRPRSLASESGPYDRRRACLVSLLLHVCSYALGPKIHISFSARLVFREPQSFVCLIRDLFELLSSIFRPLVRFTWRSISAWRNSILIFTGRLFDERAKISMCQCHGTLARFAQSLPGAAEAWYVVQRVQPGNFLTLRAAHWCPLYV